ncbi:MAG: PAS domain S-box protein [Deltaproteobacteria bacterium]|nr:MAG: PAS domain S-box protein [Deltaproteobacteria bacterium]
MIFSALINNITLIIALSILYRFIVRKWKYRSRSGQVISGFLFGAVAIIGMMNPLIISPGLIIDGRSIIISMAGFIGGWVTALVAALMSIIYRTWLGGPGGIMGVSVIASSAALGIAYHYVHLRRPHVATPLHLIGFGIIVHLCMLALTMTLPTSMKYEVLSNIAIPVILIYPLGTLLVGVVLLELESRIRAEDALRESEARFRSIFVQAAVGVAEIEMSTGRFLTVNRCLCEMVGRTEEEMLATTFQSITYPDDLHRHEEKPMLLLAGEIGYYDLEKRYIRKDGATVWVNLTSSSLWKLGNAPTRNLIVVQDITERKRTEEEKPRNQERAERLAEEMAIIAEIGRVVGSTLDINQVFERVAAEVRKLIPYDRILVNLKKDDNELVVAYASGVDNEGRSSGDLYRSKGTATRVVLTTRSGILIQPDDAEEIKDLYPNLYETFKTGLRSTMSVPLISMGEAIGSLTFRSKKLKAYTRQNLHLVEKIGAQIAGAIVNAQLFSNLSKTEKSLRESNELFSLYMRHSPIYTYIKEVTPTQSIVLQASNNFRQMIGIPGSEMAGKTMADLFPPEFAADDWAVVSSGDVLRLDEELNGRSYTTIKFPIVQRDKTLLAGYTIDITERKQAEEELRESEERFRTLSDMTPLGMSLIDIDGRYEYVNPAFVKIFGYDLPDIPTGKEWFRTAYPDPEYRREVMADWKEDLSRYPKLQIKPRIYEVRCKEGDFRTIMFRTVTLPTGKHLIIYEDITDRKQAEDALRESEERYRSLYNNTPVMLHSIDSNGNLISVSEYWLNTLGYTREEVLGRKSSDFLTEASRKYAIETVLPEFRKIKYCNNIGYQFVKKNGEVIDTLLSAISEQDENGVMVRSLAVVTDITDHKRAQEEKRVLEERLKHVDKMEAIGTLAGGIAHDFNNLLMGIQGYASLSLMNIDSSHPNYEKLKRIEEQVQSGADLTKQLLGFARGGRYEVKPTDMNDILEKSSSMFGRTKKEITIHRKFGKDLWTVEVDQGQMDQVFMNLYVNAWQAMPGGGEIYLETENVLFDNAQAVFYTIKPGKYVKITVTDTGTGMDEKTKARIFDPFFTTKSMGRGTGLGLATVYGIIKGHKGMIDVESGPGHGTTFTICLPASEKEVVKEKTANGTVTRGTETILLVDDEKMILEVNRELLEFLGYRVYATGSGQEAIAVYMERRDEIDLVILDMIMPGISGGETFDRLREINPGIKVLLSSGYSINGEAKTIMNRGCNGFIQKPFQLEKLSGKVREILDQNSAFHW